MRIVMAMVASGLVWLTRGRGRFWLSLAAGCGWVMIGCASGLPAAERAVDRSAGEDQVAARGEAPHPWLADVPPPLARLVTVGNVRFRVDDDLLNRVGKVAVTEIALTSQYAYRYEIKPLADRGDGLHARFMVQFGQPTWTVNHTIVLRRDFQPARPWETDLLRHEFDHVAISSDPRLLKLLGWLESRKVPGVVTADDEASLDTSVVSEIERQMRLRREALEALVRAYYVRLDAVTQNGLEAVPRRAAFFRHLYTYDDLRDMKFPYLPEVGASLRSVPMTQVDRHYWLQQR